MLNSFYHRFRIAPTLKKTVHTTVSGVRLTVHPTVFHPKFFRSSAFLAKRLRNIDLKGKRVLDLGTGTGILGIVAAQKGAEVTAVDINDLALEAARENAERNGVIMRVLKSNWFDAIQNERFDIIVCNPPFIKGSRAQPYGAAWHVGDNHEHVLDLVEGFERHLAPGGELLLVLSSHADVEWWIEEISADGLQGEIVARRQYLRETLILYRFPA